MKLTSCHLTRRVLRPEQEVLTWHLRPGAIERMLIPLESVRLEAQEAKVFHFSIHWRGKWRRWILKQSDNASGNEITYHQVEGPFSHWKHTRRVSSKNVETCDLEDLVEYALPFSLFSDRFLSKLQSSLHFAQELLARDLMTYAGYPTSPLRILLSGSSGLIGRSLAAFLKAGGHTVVRLVRFKDDKAQDAILWDPATGKIDQNQLEGFDAALHLAGENISSSRWTESKKEALFQSRCRDTAHLAQALSRLTRPPKTFLSASAVGFYGNRGEELLTEESSKGFGFIADLCAKWEEAASLLKQHNVRLIQSRFGYVLAPQGGMLKKMLPLYRLGLGGRLGTGEQFIPWIALDDLIGAIYHLLMTPQLEGPVNVVAPNPVRQEEFAEMIAAKLHRPTMLHLPAFLLRTLMGEMADELLLTSENVVPKRLHETGYLFRYPKLEDWLKVFNL